MRKYIYAVLIFYVINLNCFSQTTIKSASDFWEPYIYSENMPKGLSYEIVKRAFEESGYKLDFDFVPWARALHLLRSNEIDIIINMWKSSDREKYYYFSDAYITNNLVAIKRKVDKTAYKNLSDLQGKSIGVVRDYDYGDDFNKHSKIIKKPANSLIDNVKKVAQGRIDITIADELVVRRLLRSGLKNYNSKVSISSYPLIKKSLYVSSGLSNKRHKLYIEAFNKGLNAIKKNGVYKMILLKHVNKRIKSNN